MLPNAVDHWKLSKEMGTLAFTLKELFGRKFLKKSELHILVSTSREEMFVK